MHLKYWTVALVSTLACHVVLAAELPEKQTRWIKEHAIRLETVEAESGFEDLAPLRELIGDARIVSLGESTHGSREIFQMKHRFIEFLASEMGFTIFSIEANMPEAYRLNDYVLTGNGDPKQLIAGMYFWTWNTQEVLDMVDFHIKELPRGEVMILEVTFEKEVAWKLTRSDVGKTLPPEMQSGNPVYRTSQVSLIRKEIEP